jgi:hypothetical protein
MKRARERLFVFVLSLATAALAFGALGSALAAPTIVNGRNFDGQVDPEHFAHVAGAVGPTRYVQFVNRRFAVYTRANTSTTPLYSNTLVGFLEQSPSFRVDFPQVIWDPDTSRFYFTASGISGDGFHYFVYGWSKTASPNTSEDFCRYLLRLSLGGGIDNFAVDSPKLGDSRDFVLVAGNFFASGTFIDAGLVAVIKPPAGTACGAVSLGLKVMRDPAGNKLWSPAAANGIDSWAWGYLIARSFALPSNKLWLLGVTRGPTGSPTYGPVKELTLPASYDVPPAALQPGSIEKLDTGDASPSQAVIARNPDRGDRFSMWTQHTVKSGALSAVRWYEINPFPRPPVLLRRGVISAPPEHFIFNAAISPDRRVDGNTAAFGDSFVIQFNRSGGSGETAIFPQIRMGSSVNGGPLSFATVVASQDSYSDPTCPLAGNLCFWARHASCTPDPRPFQTGNRGAVWCANVYPGPDGAPVNWRSRIFAVRP